MRRIMLACLGLAAIATSASAEEWGFVRASANDVRLFYGVPESEDVTVSVICDPARKRLRVAAFTLPAGAKPGQRLRIALTAGASSAIYDGTVVRDKVHGGLYVEAAAPADTRIFDLLRLPASLTIAVGSSQEKVPLQGAADAVAKMQQACLGR